MTANPVMTLSDEIEFLKKVDVSKLTRNGSAQEFLNRLKEVLKTAEEEKDEDLRDTVVDLLEAEISRQIDEISDMIRENNEKIAELRSKIDVNTVRIQEIDVKTQSLSGKIEELKAKIDQNNHRIVKLDETIANDIENRNKTTQKSVKLNEQEKWTDEEFETALDLAVEEEELNNKVSDAQSERISLKSANTQIDAQIKENQEAIDMLSAERTELVSENEDLNAQIIELKAKQAELEAQKTALQKQMPEKPIAVQSPFATAFKNAVIGSVINVTDPSINLSVATNDPTFAAPKLTA